MFAVLFLSVYSSADEMLNENKMVEDILRDVIDRTIQEADRSIQHTTGISLSDIISGNEHDNESGKRLSDLIKEQRRNDRRSGHGNGGLPETVSDRGDQPDDVQRDLQQLAGERNRKLQQIKDELHRELSQERTAFSQENRHIEKPEILAEKRLKLEEKVHDAYNRFARKIADENQRYDQKRKKILDGRR